MTNCATIRCWRHRRASSPHDAATVRRWRAIDAEPALLSRFFEMIGSNLKARTGLNLYLEKRGKARQKLADKGIGSRLVAYTAQQDLVEHQQELQVQQGRLAGFGSRKQFRPR